MTPKERVMTALARGIPDRVPWMEGSIDESLQIRLMNGRRDYTHGALCRKLGMDAFGWSIPSGGAARASQAAFAGAAVAKAAFYHPTSVTFDFTPPWIAEMGRDSKTGRLFVKKGLLTARDKLHLFEDFLPDPNHPARYDAVAEWIARYREDFAVFARIRLGTASTIESMGLDVFSLMLYEDPELVMEIHRRFSQWCATVVEHLNEMDFDFYWAFDDIADTKSSWINPAMYEEFLKPHQLVVARTIRRPWVYHSDGNFRPVIEQVLSLGMSAIHPLQPSAMDIFDVKARYGARVCLVGNIDLDYTLTRGTPEEVEREVKEKIERVGQGGGYIVSSANSLADYVKSENALAMARTIDKYGWYQNAAARP
ncbi:MAG TPA: uroporphyrinogen decarboxylase family protein [Burkholderiales bacterium]|nr:uroporphyrinogen decarboxylase family protein [Burkholderiales bacterium]